MRKVEATQEFDGFQICSDEVLVNHLHVVDDIVLLGKTSVKNAKAMRGILRLFEMASGLKVNFQKSSLHGTNMRESHLEMFAGLIGCNVGKIAISYLGLSIGANYRKKEV